MDRIDPDLREPNETQKNRTVILLTETVPFLGPKQIFLIYSVSQLSTKGWGKTLTTHYKFKSNAIFFVVLSFFSIQDHILVKTNCARNVDVTMNGCLWQRFKDINLHISLVL